MLTLRTICILVLLSLAVPLLAWAGKDHDHEKTKSKDSHATSEVTHNHSTTITDEPGVEPGKRLDLVLKTGATVRIRGWKKSSVSVVGSHRGSECQDAKIATQETKDGVEVTSFYVGDDDVHTCSMIIEVQVPERYDVSIQSSGGGVQIENLRGTVEGHTGGGDVRLDHVRGVIDLHTGGGNLYVADSDLDGDLHSGGGDVKSVRVTGDVRLEAGGKRYR